MLPQAAEVMAFSLSQRCMPGSHSERSEIDAEVVGEAGGADGNGGRALW